MKYDEHMPSRPNRLLEKTAQYRTPSPIQAVHPVPVVSHDDGVVTLHFGSNFIQSQMVVAEPDSLALAYTRAMMAFEFFLPKPRKIALLGLGGGSIAKWCYRHHPRARITVVEINPHVIAVGKTFGIPKASQRFRILCEDGAKFVANAPDRFDVLLIDCCTSDYLPPELCSQEFFDHCKEALTDSSLMVVNLCSRSQIRIISRIRKAFDGQVLLSRDAGGNTVVFACKGRLLWPENEDEVSFRLKLKRFERKYGLGKAMAPRG
jgi:spermidine synthase